MWNITWSLAAEQQFYLVWPLVLAVLALALRRYRPADTVGRGHGLLLAAGFCVVGYGLEALRQLAVREAGDVGLVRRLVFAPEGRSLVLLLGCALALLEARRRVASRSVLLGRSEAVAAIALLVLVVCFARGRLDSGPGGLVPFLVAGVGSLVLIRALVHASPGSGVARMLGARPVAWLGRVSYSLYLWHEVAYRLAEQVSPAGTLPAEVLRFVLAVGFAAASYHGVEQPVQRWWSRRGEEARADDRVLVATS